jgi:thymidylate synthase
MNIITGYNVPHLYEETLWALRAQANMEESRNGDVLAMPGPSLLQLQNPRERVLWDENRNANPFFHVMETIWMLSGENRVDWLLPFNRGYSNYAEDDGVVHGAYGHRWRRNFLVDQIIRTIELLKSNPKTRRAVIGMWDPSMDCETEETLRDVPCNTHLYFRVVDGTLQMTVCNRSNDAIWGALGANVVHMTYLQELIAHGAGLSLGMYRVFSNNLHIYRNREDFVRVWDAPPAFDFYHDYPAIPLLYEKENAADFLKDCENFVKYGPKHNFTTQWMYDVACQMYFGYMERVNKEGDGKEWVKNIVAPDWRKACELWIKRKS